MHAREVTLESKLSSSLGTSRIPTSSEEQGKYSSEDVKIQLVPGLAITHNSTQSQVVDPTVDHGNTHTQLQMVDPTVNHGNTHTQLQTVDSPVNHGNTHTHNYSSVKHEQ